MVTMYGIKNCDTIKKARSWLEARGVAYAFHDYKAEGIDAATLAPLKNRKTPGRLCAAVHLGRARLIDNIPLPPKK